MTSSETLKFKKKQKIVYIFCKVYAMINTKS